MTKTHTHGDLGFTEPTESDGPVECPAMTCESDDAHRTHFIGLLREKLLDGGRGGIQAAPPTGGAESFDESSDRQQSGLSRLRASSRGPPRLAPPTAGSQWPLP